MKILTEEAQVAGNEVLARRGAYFPYVAVGGRTGFDRSSRFTRDGAVDEALTIPPNGRIYNPLPMSYFFDINAVFANAAGSLVAPLLNKAAIKADFMTANARRLQALYDYQQTVVDAFTEVVNRVTAVENYRRSVKVKRQQLASMDASVETATKLFQLPRGRAAVDYLDVLFAQRDLLDARAALIETKRRQVAAAL